MNWGDIYKSEVSPVMANFSSGPPVWVYAIVGTLAIVGIALLVWAPLKVKLGGAALLFFCGFIGFMLLRNSGIKAGEPAEFCAGKVLKKYEKKQVVKKTTGMMEPEISYWIDLETIRCAKFDDSGIVEEETAPPEPRSITLAENLYGALAEGQEVTGVILPTARNAFHFLVSADGSIQK